MFERHAAEQAELELAQARAAAAEAKAALAAAKAAPESGDWASCSRLPNWKLFF